MAQVEPAWCFYQEMKWCNTIADTTTYTILLHSLWHSGMAIKATDIWSEMVQRGLKPNKDIYNGILDALASQNNLEMGISIFKRMAEEGANSDFLSCEAILKLLCKARQVGRTLELAHRIKEKSAKVKVFESFIKALGKMGHVNEVFLFVDGLLSDDVRQSQAVYVGVIDALCSTTEPKKALSMLSVMEKNIGNVPINSYNSVMAALCWCNLFELAYDVLKQIQGKGLSPDPDLYNSIIVGLSEGKL